MKETSHIMRGLFCENLHFINECEGDLCLWDYGHHDYGYQALVLRLPDEVVEALFVTYDLWK